MGNLGVGNIVLFQIGRHGGGHGFNIGRRAVAKADEEEASHRT